MKKRNKTYKPKPVRGNMFIAGYRILQPVQVILDQLDRDGTVYVDSNGRAVLNDGEETYEIVPALAGLIDWIQLRIDQAGIELDLAPLTQLKNQLHYAMPITEQVFNACKDLMPALRRVVSLMPADKALSNIRTTQIKAELHGKYDVNNNYTGVMA